MAMHDIDFGFGVLHMDVGRARLRRHAKWVRMLGALGALLIIALIAYAPLQPVLFGTGTLAISGVVPGADLHIDGRAVIGSGSVFTLITGTHQIDIKYGAMYPQALAVHVPRDRTVAVAIPPARPRPTVQSIPLPAPGATWRMVSPDVQSGWRLRATDATSVQTPPPNSMARAGASAPAPQQQTLLRLSDRGLVRLAAIESFPASDEVHTSDGRYWATWEPATNNAMVSSAGGVLSVSTPAGPVTTPTDTTLTGLWWAPDGRWLLVAARQGMGQTMALWSNQGGVVQDGTGSPIVTIPGTIQAVQWSPSGQAALILSSRGPDTPGGPLDSGKPLVLEATLVLPDAQLSDSRALTMSTPPAAALGMVPLAWGRDALWWVTASNGELNLEHIPFSAALPTRLGVLPPDLVALTVINGDQIRVLAQNASGALRVQTWPGNDQLFVFDDIPVSGTVSGLWNGTTLLASDGPDRLWNVTFAPSALQ